MPGVETYAGEQENSQLVLYFPRDHRITVAVEVPGAEAHVTLHRAQIADLATRLDTFLIANPSV